MQDVSDRVEKADYQSEPLLTLEKNSKFVCRGDWNLHLDECITSDLKKYRGYHGNSVRDLLRAVRNKVRKSFQFFFFLFKFVHILFVCSETSLP